MAVIERQTVIATKDKDGNTVMHCPVTSVKYVEGAVRTVNGIEPDANGDVLVAGLPIGHEWFTTNPNIPTGCLPLFGGTFSRTAYADLWTWVQTQGSYLITEAEWQAKATANDGNVAFYSDGDGSTTFRVPSLKCHVQGANGVEKVGSYLAAGLPNIEGYVANLGLNSDETKANYSGAFVPSDSTNNYGGSSSGSPKTNLAFDASASNSIYGASDTVQPPSIVGMYLVKAFGTVSNVGNQDIADISAGLTRVETTLATIAPPVGTVIAQAGNYAPDGYLMCNGAAVSRTTYANLFAVIGTTYGEGNGSTTFTLPNLTDRFIQGSSTAGTIKEAGLPNITGTILSVGEDFGLFAPMEVTTTGAFVRGNEKGRRRGGGDSSTFNPTTLTFDASKSNSVYGASNTVQPPAVAMRYYIKY